MTKNLKNLAQGHQRNEVNNNYAEDFEKMGVIFSGYSPDGLLPEIVELTNHPWFIGVQYHPELKSKPFDPHPLFKSFVMAANKKSLNLATSVGIVLAEQIRQIKN